MGLAANLRKRVLNGESADLVILTRPAMDDLQKQNKLAPGSLANVGGTPVSVAVRAGAPKPDIRSVNAFKHALLSARSIVYADPGKGGASGVYFAHVLDRLGLAEQLKPKAIAIEAKGHIGARRPGAGSCRQGGSRAWDRTSIRDFAGQRRTMGRAAARRSGIRHRIRGGSRGEE